MFEGDMFYELSLWVFTGILLLFGLLLTVDSMRRAMAERRR